MSNAPDLSKLSSTFANKPLASHGTEWDTLWRESFTPWDRGGPSAALAEALLSAKTEHLFQLDVERPQALVPGCGQGHDVLLLAALGYDVVGLDVSAEATRRAMENEARGFGAIESFFERVMGMGVEEGTVQRGIVTWVTGDFWEDAYLKGVGSRGFDLIFDYTFLCALPPSARPRWAQRMSELLAPSGRLVCLEWPYPGTRDAKTGPPWMVTPELYLALLARPGEEVEYDDNNIVKLDVAMTPYASGLKRLAHFTPNETHKAGTAEAGNVLDRVSIWGHV